MIRRFVIAGILCALAAALVPLEVSAQTTPPVYDDPMRAFSIVPPGNDGNITPAEFATSDFGPHFNDQFELYQSLIETNDVTEATLGSYFHSMGFTPEEVEREY